MLQISIWASEGNLHVVHQLLVFLLLGEEDFKIQTRINVTKNRSREKGAGWGAYWQNK